MRWYLDFDGVLCDSIPEIWAVSRRAIVPRDTRAWVELSKDEQAAFLSLRPFISRGAEYLTLQRCLTNGTWRFIPTLAKWRELLNLRTLEEDQRTLDGLRDLWLETDPGGWTSLNFAYPGIVEALCAASPCRNVVIFSTKKPGFISAILKSWNVDWDPDRIEHTETRKAEILDRRRERYTLVDDQIDHLNFQSRVGRSVLAAWGWVTDEALAQAKETWSLKRFLTEFKKDLDFPGPLPKGKPTPVG